jgi:Zn-dependent peptidase ImmA (M78 family)
MITAYESGDKSPSSPTLADLASALRFPVTFLTSRCPSTVTPEMASFRSLKGLSASQRDRALAAAELAVELDLWISQRFELPEATTPDLREMPPRQAGLELRRLWDLNDGPIPDVISLLEYHGVRVYSLSEDCLSLDAFSFWMNGTPFAMLNTRKSGERSRMDAAHELGHLVLHRGEARSRESEQEATTFAAAFLMPEQAIRSHGASTPTMDEVLRHKRQWGVSAVAYIYRLWDLELITEWQYRSLMVTASSRGFRATEPNALTPETSVVLQDVLEALADDGIGRGDIAEQLSLPRREVDSLTFGLSRLRSR